MYCSSKKILSLVEGFLAALGFLFLTRKLPKPLISILSPFAKDFLIVFKKNLEQAQFQLLLNLLLDDSFIISSFVILIEYKLILQY